METTVPLVIAAATVVLMGLGAIWDDRRARAKRKEVVEQRRIELPLLHSINDDRCIGCEACVDVCPTEVLELQNHIVTVARFSDCVQCEQCANACPTTALVMYREGTVPRTLTVPELDDHFQTGVPGQYLIGEVAGKPLVKNAANLGRAVVEHIAKELKVTPGPGGDVVDVAIVGSGPGGLSAGLTCLKMNLSVIVLEKEHVISSTVSRYPKGKHFMAEPATVPNLSYLPVFDASKEELVAAWQKVVAGVKLPVKLGEAVETVKRGDDGIFTIKTTVATYKARTVVLATGLRGKPRLLVVPGANLEKVASRLDDPADFAGQHVLVVGGGDSAVEAALSLVDVDATVTLSYRGDGFKRCKQGNQKKLAEYQGANKLAVHLESNVTEFTPDQVSIKLKDGSVTTIPNQAAFVLIGADTPVAWLEANNVRFVEREHLYALGSTEDAVRKVVPDAQSCPKSADEAIVSLLGIAPGKPATRPSAPRKEHSVVAQIRNELKEAVTELTGVFRLTPAQAAALRGGGPAKKGGKAPPPPPRKVSATAPPPPPAPQPKLFPHKNVVIRSSRDRSGFTGEHTAIGRNPFAGLTGEHTALAKNPFGATGERTAIGRNPFDGLSGEHTALSRDPFGDEAPTVGVDSAKLAKSSMGFGADEGRTTKKPSFFEMSKRTEAVPSLRDDGKTTVGAPAYRDEVDASTTIESTALPRGPGAPPPPSESTRIVEARRVERDSRAPSKASKPR